jgi:phosphoribosyl 1,2-cyclic phosphodiesterase
MIQLCSLASGSSGNSIYIGTDQAHILVDAGVSGKRIEQGLASINIDPKTLQGILVTHEHSDHICGLGVMARRYRLPLYLTYRTWEAINSKNKIGKIDESLLHFIIPDEAFSINDLMIKPFRTSHDAVESVCYSFENGDKKIGFATDLGVYDDYILDQLRDSNVLYIEANHDVSMLEAGSYPYYLKQRILSDLGHLSNECSSRLILDVISERLEHIILAHLSKENNHPDIAYITIKTLLDEIYKETQQQINLTVANRDYHSNPIVIH